MNIRHAMSVLAGLFLPIFVCGMDLERPNSVSKRRLSFGEQGEENEFVPVKKMRLDEPSVEPELKQQPVKVNFFTSDDDLPYRIKEIYENPGFTNYVSQDFVYSQQGIIDAMNKAAQERKAKVNLSLGRHSQNKPLSEYKVDSVVVDKDQHGKNTVAFNYDPSNPESIEQDEKKVVFRTGSVNSSNAGWRNRNKEVMVSVEGDTELAEQAYSLMTSKSPVKKKQVVTDTPTKRSAYSSQKTKFNKSRAARIETIAHQEGPGRIAWASTMNINDKHMQNALSEAAKNGVDTRLIVHKSALTKNGIPLLQSLVDSGVKVSVFFPPAGSRRIYHNKELIRECLECPEKDLYVISNANFTDEGDAQKNLETYFPNDPELLKKAKTNFEKNEKQSIPLRKALELQQEQKEEKKAKKKPRK